MESVLFANAQNGQEMSNSGSWNAGASYGYFSDPTYTSIGEPYRNMATHDSRSKGLNFKTSWPKQGKLNDSTFNPFQSLYAGDVNVQSEEKRKKAQERQQAQVSKEPFRPVSPGKDSTGLGTNYGCIGSQPEHKLVEEQPKKTGSEIRHEPPNVKTNPPRKGSYGYKGVTLSERVGTEGVAKEYAYLEDKFAHRDAERAGSRKEALSKPFRPPEPPKAGKSGFPNTTLAKGHGVAGEYKYVEEGPREYQYSEKVEKPFKPTSPAKRGYNAAFGRFPQYKEDPQGKSMADVRAERNRHSQILQSRAPFTPTSGYKSDRTQSIMRAEWDRQHSRVLNG